MDIIQLEERLETFLAGLGFELVDFQVQTVRRGRTYRIFIDRLDEGSVDIVTLSNLSKQIRLQLEVQDSFDDNTSLEVSSPGMDRLIKKPKHFIRFIGKKVKLHFRANDGTKYSVHGKIINATNDFIDLSMTKGEAFRAGFPIIPNCLDGDKPVVKLPFEAVLLCRLSFEV